MRWLFNAFSFLLISSVAKLSGGNLACDKHNLNLLYSLLYLDRDNNSSNWKTAGLSPAHPSFQTRGTGSSPSSTQCNHCHPAAMQPSETQQAEMGLEAGTLLGAFLRPWRTGNLNLGLICMDVD